LLGGAAAAWPLAARAQQSARVWRIGWLSPGSGPGASTQEFLGSMRDRGYAEGQNLAIEYRWAANSDEQMALLAADLVRSGVDLIVTAGTPATVAAKQATPTIPIVFAVAGAPVEKGLVDSLAHPGGNVTGRQGARDFEGGSPQSFSSGFHLRPQHGSGRVRGGLAESSSGQVTHPASGLAARHLGKTA